MAGSRRPASASSASIPYRPASTSGLSRPGSALTRPGSALARPGSALGRPSSGPRPELGLPHVLAPLLHSASDYLSADIARRMERALELEREQERVRRKYSPAKARRTDGGPAVPESPYFRPYKGTRPASAAEGVPGAQELLESILRPKSTVFARLYHDAELKNRAHLKWLESRAIPEPKRPRPRTAPGRKAAGGIRDAEDPYAGLEEQEHRVEEQEAAAAAAGGPAGWGPARVKEVIGMLARALAGGDVEEAMRIYAEEVPPGVSRQELDGLKIQAMKLARDLPPGAPAAAPRKPGPAR